MVLVLGIILYAILKAHRSQAAEAADGTATAATERTGS